MKLKLLGLIEIRIADGPTNEYGIRMGNEIDKLQKGIDGHLTEWQKLELDWVKYKAQYLKSTPGAHGDTEGNIVSATGSMLIRKGTIYSLVQAGAASIQNGKIIVNFKEMAKIINPAWQAWYEQNKNRATTGINDRPGSDEGGSANPAPPKYIDSVTGQPTGQYVNAATGDTLSWFGVSTLVPGISNGMIVGTVVAASALAYMDYKNML